MKKKPTYMDFGNNPTDYVVLRTVQMTSNNNSNNNTITISNNGNSSLKHQQQQQAIGKIDNLSVLLQESESVTNFRQYLDSINHGHFLDFWFACQGYRNFDKSDNHKLYQLTKVIYRAYIRSESPYAVPLKSNTKKDIVDKLSDRNCQVDQTIFDNAQEEIKEILSGELLKDFLMSNFYIDSKSHSIKLSESLNNEFPPTSSCSSTGHYAGNSGHSHYRIFQPNLAASHSSDAVLDMVNYGQTGASAPSINNTTTTVIGSNTMNAATAGGTGGVGTVGMTTNSSNNINSNTNVGYVGIGLGLAGGNVNNTNGQNFIKDRRNLSEVDPAAFARVLASKLETLQIEQSKFERMSKLVRAPNSNTTATNNNTATVESDTDESSTSAINYLLRYQLQNIRNYSSNTDRAGVDANNSGTTVVSAAVDNSNEVGALIATGPVSIGSSNNINSNTGNIINNNTGNSASSHHQILSTNTLIAKAASKLKNMTGGGCSNNNNNHRSIGMSSSDSRSDCDYSIVDRPSEQIAKCFTIHAQDILESHCSRIGAELTTVSSSRTRGSSAGGGDMGSPPLMHSRHSQRHLYRMSHSRDRSDSKNRRYREQDLGSTTSYDSGVVTSSLEQYSSLGMSGSVLLLSNNRKRTSSPPAIFPWSYAGCPQQQQHQQMNLLDSNNNDSNSKSYSIRQQQRCSSAHHHHHQHHSHHHQHHPSAGFLPPPALPPPAPPPQPPLPGGHPPQLSVVNTQHRHHHHHGHWSSNRTANDLPFLDPCNVGETRLFQNAVSDVSSAFDSGISSAYEHLGKRYQPLEDKVHIWMSKNPEWCQKEEDEEEDKLDISTGGDSGGDGAVIIKEPDSILLHPNTPQIPPRYPGHQYNRCPSSAILTSPTLTATFVDPHPTTTTITSTCGGGGSGSSQRSPPHNRNQTLLSAAATAATTTTVSTTTTQSQSIVIGYYIGNDPVPYRTQVTLDDPSHYTITLGQFKNIVAKKGNFRYFFKRYCDEFDCGVVHEEITKDDSYLPLWEGKIVAKIERVE